MPWAIALVEWYLPFHRVWASLVQRLLCDAITHHPDYVPSTCCKSVTKGRAALRLPQHVPVHSVMRERGSIGGRVVLIPQNILPLRILARVWAAHLWLLCSGVSHAHADV